MKCKTGIVNNLVSVAYEDAGLILESGTGVQVIAQFSHKRFKSGKGYIILFNDGMVTALDTTLIDFDNGIPTIEI